VLGLVDIRADSPTFRNSVQFEWADSDGVAIVVPRGVAHVVRFVENSVLAFGLSGYWTPDFDVIGCQWDDPELRLQWPDNDVVRSTRDLASGGFAQMLADYEARSTAWRELQRLGAREACLVR
jgi:dTDP-4-dehydrorhamnose 3,5-epimerase